MIKIYKQAVEERLKIMLEFLNSVNAFEVGKESDNHAKRSKAKNS